MQYKIIRIIYYEKIIIYRASNLLQLSAIVDGIYAEHAHTAGSFTRLASDELLVGGGADTKLLQGAKGITNFVGCLRKVGTLYIHTFNILTMYCSIIKFNSCLSQ